MIAPHGVLQLSRRAFLENVRVTRGQVQAQTQIALTLKANGYGHGWAQMADLARAAGLSWVVTYNLDEAVQVHQHQPELDILVLSAWRYQPDYILSSDAHAALASGRVRMTIITPDDARAWDAYVVRAQLGKVPVHVQLDCGLTRGGAAESDWLPLVTGLRAAKALRLEGLFAHFSHGECPGHPALLQQWQRFQTFVRAHGAGLLTHIQNSGGTWSLGAQPVQMVRVGIALYGLQAGSEPTPGLQPIARLLAPIIALHDVVAGIGAGYGHTFVTTRPSRLAIVPVGYADGYPRALSNRAMVAVAGQLAPVVGRVSMDQIIVDVTRVAAAGVGTPVEVISPDPAAPHSVEKLAALCGTIGYEVATGFGPRLQREVCDGF